MRALALTGVFESNNRLLGGYPPRAPGVIFPRSPGYILKKKKKKKIRYIRGINI
jgi:hypothetical protein